MDNKRIVLQPSAIEITALVNAAKTLTEVLALPVSSITRDAAIKRFEFCFELAWKTMKRLLAYEGIVAKGPRTACRLAARQGYIDSVEAWFKALEARNETVHTYDEVQASKIFDELAGFNELLQSFIQKIMQ